MLGRSRSVGSDFAAGLNFSVGLEFAAGLENYQAKPGTTASDS